MHSLRKCLPVETPKSQKSQKLFSLKNYRRGSSRFIAPENPETSWNCDSACLFQCWGLKTFFFRTSEKGEIWGCEISPFYHTMQDPAYPGGKCPLTHWVSDLVPNCARLCVPGWQIASCPKCKGPRTNVGKTLRTGLAKCLLPEG